MILKIRTITGDDIHNPLVREIPVYKTTRMTFPKEGKEELNQGNLTVEDWLKKMHHNHECEVIKVDGAVVTYQERLQTCTVSISTIEDLLDLILSLGKGILIDPPVEWDNNGEWILQVHDSYFD